MPGIHQVLQSFWELGGNGMLFRHAVASLFRVTVGFYLALLVAIPAGLLLGRCQMRTGRPGPVMLEFPADVAGIQIEDEAFSYSPVKAGKTMADPESVTASVKVIVAARKPLLHAGNGVLFAKAWDELREFAELLQIPVMTTLPGKSCFPENHPLSLGCGGLTGPSPVARYLLDCDLIFGVGSSFSISPFAAPIPRGKVAVQLRVDERDLNKDYPVDFLMMGDAKLTLRQMIVEAKRLLGPEGRKGEDRAARAIKVMRDDWLDEWMPKLTSSEVPINPYRVIWDLQQAVSPEKTIVTHDAGNPRDQTAPFWKALVPNSYIGWGKSTHLGYSLPLALGAKVAKPEKTVVHIMGDAAWLPGYPGLRWGEALAMITSGPALAVGMGGDIGSLAPGRRADVVIWSGEPLEGSSAAEQVYIDGVQQPLESRQTKLLQRYRHLPRRELPEAYRH